MQTTAGSFCLASGSTVCVVGSSASSLRATSFVWDPHSQCFSPPFHRCLPLSGDVQLLAARVVHNYALGESQPHLVIRKENTLLIGWISIDTHDFMVLVEVELPPGGQRNESTFEGCWLEDGPNFIAELGKKKFVIIRSSICADQSGFQPWDAQLLNFDNIGKASTVRAIYYGELELFSEPALLLSIQFLDENVFEQLTPQHRLRLGWNFVKLSTNFSGDASSQGIFCSSVSWNELQLGNCLEVRNQLFPSDLCPDSISCVCAIPKGPVVNQEFLMDKHRDPLFHDVVVGFWNGKIAKYRIGKALAETNLKEALISLQFSIVAGGQGVLLCILNGETRSVAVLCAETLVTLKVWSGLREAVIGDFQSIGHDQLVLLSSSIEIDDSSSSQFYCDLTPVYLTDLKHCYFSRSEEPPMQDPSVDASEQRKMKNLDAIAQCLQSRLEAGYSQMKCLEDQIIKKLELVQTSCKLLQDMTIDHERSILDEAPEQNFMADVVCTAIKQQGICGRTWFICINIENISQGDIVLHDLSLSLTSIRGPISGRSSVLDSLHTRDKERYLVSAVSLSDLPPTSTSLVIHILLDMTHCKSDHLLEAHTISAVGHIQSDRKISSVHKIWIGQVKMCDILALRSLEPRYVPLEFREVAEQQALMIRKNYNEEPLDVVNVIKSALWMEDRLERQKDAVYELVASQGVLWSDVTIIPVEEAMIFILRAEDSKHMSHVKTSLLKQLKNNFTICAFPELLQAIHTFIEVFKKELLYKQTCLKDVDHVTVCEGLHELESYNVKILRDLELQMSTDRSLGILLGRLNDQDMGKFRKSFK